MPDNHNPIRIILVTLALLALAVITWRISDVVIVTFGAVVGAATIRALADPLSRVFHLSDHWAISLVLLALVAVFSAAVWLFGGQMIGQAEQLRSSVPDAWNKLLAALNESQLGRALVESLRQSSTGSQTLANVGIATGVLAAAVMDVLLLVFLSLYLAYDPDEYVDGFLRLLPPPRRAQVKRALVDAGAALRSWLLAQLIAMAIIGVLVGVAMALLRVPLALLLGCIAGLLEFVPVAGAVAFTIPGVLLAFAKGPALALYALIAYVVVQQIESNVIIPLLQRWAVRLPPGITLTSVVVGGVLFGVMGVVFATPLAVVVMALVKHLYVEDTLEDPKAATAEGPGVGGPEAKRA